MTTKVYGASDDLIEFEGDYSGEHGQYNTSEDLPVALFISDGTVMLIWYSDQGIWKIDVRQKGALFKSMTICTSEDDDPYSDVVTFDDGIKWAYAVRVYKEEGFSVIN